MFKKIAACGPIKPIEKNMANKLAEILTRNFGEGFSITKSDANEINKVPITAKQIENVIDEMEKFKVELKPSLFVDYDTVTIIDHEKIREDNPLHSERGKTIIYNPKNKKVAEEFKKMGYKEE